MGPSAFVEICGMSSTETCALGGESPVNQGDIDGTSARRELMREVSDDLTDLLVENREEEARGREELRRLRDERSELLWSARADGLNMSAMARAAGVNRQMAYELVREAESRREPERERDLVPRSPEETAEALDTDPRYLSVEDAVAVFELLPAADQIVWPVEAFDVRNVDEAMAWVDKEWPLIRASWRALKARGLLPPEAGCERGRPVTGAQAGAQQP